MIFSSRYLALVSKFGPGFLLAAMCIGVSHLVQATRAGADYGFSLVWLVVFACLIKYPAIRFGSDYASITGETLIEAYARQGRWITFLFAVLLAIEMFVATPAVTLVTAGIVKYVFGISLTDVIVVGLLLVLCYVILIYGKYKLFEGLTKLFVLLFAVLTIIAASVAITQSDWNVKGMTQVIEYDRMTILFMIAIAGWMPTTVTASVIQSIWVCAKNRSQNRQLDYQLVKFDFNVGYFLTIGLALCFVLLGTAIMHTSEVEVASSSVDFAGQLISLFTKSIGEFAYFVIATSALVVMFSTVLTLLDGFTRTADAVVSKILNDKEHPLRSIINYPTILLAQITISVLVLITLLGQFKTFIDISASLAFITAPFIALFNHRAMMLDEIPIDCKPGPMMRVWSIVGMISLAGFAVVYFYFHF